MDGGSSTSSVRCRNSRYSTLRIAIHIYRFTDSCRLDLLRPEYERNHLEARYLLETLRTKETRKLGALRLRARSHCHVLASLKRAAASRALRVAISLGV